MKSKSLGGKLAQCGFAAANLLPCLAMAQGMIQQANEPFIPKPEIPFSLPHASKGGGEKSSTAAIASPSQAPEPAVTKSIPTPLKPSWEIQVKDITLASTFQRWAAVAGWQVRWDARKHVLVEAPDRIGGSFEDAVTAVLEGPGIAGSAYPLEVCFYPNQPPLARITRKGEQDKECR